MKQFRIMFYEPQIIVVNAEDEQQAIETVKKQMLQKQADIHVIKVIDDNN